MTLFRQVVPNSIHNPSNERYQYFLVWLSNEGGVRSWLFSHTKGEEEDDFDNFMIEGLDNIRSVPSMERKEVRALTRSLNPDDFAYVKSILSSNRVYQLKEDFTKVPIALRGTAIDRPNQLKEYEVKIRFMFQEADILNV